MNIHFNFKTIRLFVATGLLSCLSFSCQKLLDEKPDKTVTIPENLNDLQALLDMHNYMVVSSPDILELLADNYYVPSTYWKMVTDEERLSYVWDENSPFLLTWQMGYQGPVYYSNVVLDVLATLDIKEMEKVRAEEIKGTALFHRALTFQQLAQVYCRPYSETAMVDPGLPLRLTAAIEVKTARSTVQQTYDQIIGDLKAALEILPDKSLFPTRPTKAAAFGLLARTYLSMRDYENALNYSNLYLELHPELMNYSEITDRARPFKRFNVETVFYNNALGRFILLSAGIAMIDSKLYSSYHENDLRKQLFFKENSGASIGTYQFQGNYDSDRVPGIPFIGGIATDEIYLIRAESYARSGNKELAMNDLNTLMINRWAANESWRPFTAGNAEEALLIILTERRKELVFRGLRWSDLRRFNLEGANITLTRKLDDEVYTLPPNDPRWVLLLPDEVINRSDIEQNPREK